MNILWIVFLIPTITLTQTEIMNYIEHLMNAPSSYQSLTEMDNYVKAMIDMGDCAINVMGDLKDFAPLLIYHSRLDWLVPNTEGIKELRKGDFIDMYCTYSFAEPFINYTALTAQCIQDLDFKVDGNMHRFEQFRCMECPKYEAQRTGRPCNGGTDLLRVGFEVSSGFLQTMDICFDEMNEVTRYVHHELNPSCLVYQHMVQRIPFMESGFFGGKDVNKLYSKMEQMMTISNILGTNVSMYFFNDFLSRGHLAAKSDFILASPQRATFLFVNAAPQWQQFNDGNWKSIETSVRLFVANHKLTVDCYTGIWGISTLADSKGMLKELFLAFTDNDSRGLIPVPKIYFRIVIDRETRKGIVLIGVNSPFVMLDQIEAEYIVCNDISEKIHWIDWCRKCVNMGYSYACSVPDFLDTVKDLPIDDLNTNGILGIGE